MTSDLTKRLFTVNCSSHACTKESDGQDGLCQTCRQINADKHPEKPGVKVCGIDYSTKAVDIVLVPYEGTGAPVWHRFPLTGTDAFDRTRSVADAMPGRASVLWDDVLACGIEHPGGHHGVGPLLRIQGAILARIPARILVEPFPPGKWRKAVGLPGNASKEQVMEFVKRRPWESIPWRNGKLTQDECDAYCVALATRNAIHKGTAGVLLERKQVNE